MLAEGGIRQVRSPGQTCKMGATGLREEARHCDREFALLDGPPLSEMNFTMASERERTCSFS